MSAYALIFLVSKQRVLLLEDHMTGTTKQKTQDDNENSTMGNNCTISLVSTMTLNLVEWASYGNKQGMGNKVSLKHRGSLLFHSL